MNCQIIVEDHCDDFKLSNYRRKSSFDRFSSVFASFFIEKSRVFFLFLCVNALSEQIKGHEEILSNNVIQCGCAKNTNHSRSMPRSCSVCYFFFFSSRSIKSSDRRFSSLELHFSWSSRSNETSYTFCIYAYKIRLIYAQISNKYVFLSKQQNKAKKKKRLI